MKKQKIIIFTVLLLIIIGGVYVSLHWMKPQPTVEDKKVKIIYGISPYQDTILPVVAEKKGWYREEGLDVQLKVLPWGDVMNALAAGAVDVAIQNFNSFQATYHNIVDRGGDIIFYYPLFVFKGAAIMIKPNGEIKPLREMIKEYPDRDTAIIETAKQLKGKKIAVTKGTEMEQIVLAALKKAGLEENDVKIIHAQPDDGLRAFLKGSVDAFSGGVTERTEAGRHGAIVMIEASDLSPPVIDGLVARKEFVDKHGHEPLLKLIKLWFKTIRYMESDLDTNAKLVIDYLSTVASTHYTIEEYKYTWFNTEIYPRNILEMEKTLFDPDSPYFWKKSWDGNNAFLLAEKKINRPVPYEASWMEKIHKIYIEKFGKEVLSSIFWKSSQELYPQGFSLTYFMKLASSF